MALKDRLRELDKLLDALEDEEFDIEAESSAICIAGRNEYSRGAIQQDFSQGIRELDMENAEEENPDDFDPDEEKRDYDEVARSLPVFRVSSRAYQRLCGRMKKDTEVAGFTDIAQTEVPQLQVHCKKLTVKGHDGTGIKLTSQQLDAEKSFLVRKLKELEAHLETVVEETLKDATETLTDQLFAKLDPAVSSAISEALPKAGSWGLPKPDGGLHWSTYRATVRRSGVFAGSGGARDINNELTEPIYRQLATIWEKVFQRRLPNILLSFKKSATNVVKQFHAAVETRSRERGTGATRLNMLTRQLDQYSATCGDLCAVAVNSLNEGQREINREFVPVIAEAMEPAYSSAAEERGTGSVKRMKARVTGHVDVHKTQMFGQASQQVRASLLKLCRTIKENMLGKADEVYLAMQRDYTSAFSGVSVGDIKMSREDRVARREVDQVITAADKHFQDSLDTDLEELKAKFGIGNANDRIAENDHIDQDDFMDDKDFEESDEEVDDDTDLNDESVEGHEDDMES
ncbi:hypothetical protein Slin15195_G017820 [Septoria linicola]|uniref:DUF7605 domain-containing protein n=1 Tax=Septoria linicola TaxID=215465 RepID=A0A9Q9ALT1_9PEZI|nr:hypothetical protein Slin15195_G017820 [Septoria linicola]